VPPLLRGSATVAPPTLWLAATPLAWLLANHYSPWVSAWQESVALGLLAIAVLTQPSPVRLPRLWAAWVGVSLLVVLVQTLTGRIFFGGDALMAALYLAAFAAAVALGGTLAGEDGPKVGPGLTALSAGLLAGAIPSVGVALGQWTGAAPGSLWLADMPPGARPYGNVAQPNHLATICMLGLVASGLLLQCRSIGRPVFWLVAGWCLLGMVMSGSRTAWLQVGLLALIIWVAGPKHQLPLGRPSAVALLAVLAAGVLAWPALNTLMLLQEGRPLADSVQPGTRMLHWSAMVAAMAREPLWGYGWQQVSVAQVRGADQQPFVGEFIEHSHNLVLDLMVWNGLPVGTLLLALALGWLLTRMRAPGSAAALWLLAGITGLAAHAMVEFPLEYAYFLIPLGLFIGAVDQLQQRSGGIAIGKQGVRAFGAALAVALGCIGYEYLKAEQAHRLLRLESARIGVSGLQTAPPQLHLLTQLDALLRFAHTQAKPGMTPEQVDQMRQVYERYAYPPVMLRYALAAGLNGQPDVAAIALLRLCRIHAKPRCDEARDSWSAAQDKFPVLRAIAPPPAP
jgi:hypothetical protein